MAGSHSFEDRLSCSPLRRKSLSTKPVLPCSGPLSGLHASLSIHYSPSTSPLTEGLKVCWIKVAWEHNICFLCCGSRTAIWPAIKHHFTDWNMMNTVSGQRQRKWNPHSWVMWRLQRKDSSDGANNKWVYPLSNRGIQTPPKMRSLTNLFLWLVEVFDDVVHSLPDGLLDLGRSRFWKTQNSCINIEAQRRSVINRPPNCYITLYMTLLTGT